jgi:hypothetical protein
MADASNGDGAASPNGFPAPRAGRRKPRGPRPKRKYHFLNQLQVTAEELEESLLYVINRMSPKRQAELAEALLRDPEGKEFEKKVLGDSHSEG